MAIKKIDEKKKKPLEITSVTAGPAEPIHEGLQKQLNQPQETQPTKSFGQKFVEKATSIPILGTPIKTIATGLSTMLGQGKAAEEMMGPVSYGDIAQTAVTLGGLAAGGYAIGRYAFPVSSRIFGGTAGKSKLIGQSINVDKVAKSYGMTASQARGLARELGKRRVSEIADLVLKSKTGILKKAVFGSSLKSAGTRIGTGMLVGWFGADTLAQGASINANKVASDVRYGYISQAEGLAHLNTLQSQATIAKTAVLASMAIAPLTIPLGLMYLSSANAAQNQIDYSRRLVERY